MIIQKSVYVYMDIVYNIIKEMSASIPSFKPSINVIEEMIKQGILGRKAKEGFYKY